MKDFYAEVLGSKKEIKVKKERVSTIEYRPEYWTGWSQDTTGKITKTIIDRDKTSFHKRQNVDDDYKKRLKKFKNLKLENYYYKYDEEEDK